MLVRIFVSCVIFLVSFSAVSRVDLNELKKKMDYLPPVRLSRFVEITKKPFSHLRFYKLSFYAGMFSKKVQVYDGNLIGINPFSGEEYDIPFIYYKSKRKGKRPLVVIFPAIGGVTVIETYMAKYLAKKGINAVIAVLTENISDPERPTTDMDGFLIRTSVSVRILLDHMLEQPEIDERKVGVFGCSLGGIRSLLLTGVDSRIKSAVAFVGGGNVAEIIAKSEQAIIKKYREIRMKIEGIETNDEFLDHLQRVITVDPIYFAGNAPTDRILMIISDNDEKVPSANQFELWEALGRPEHHIIHLNHVRSVISSMYSKKRTRRFFHKSWNSLYGVKKGGWFRRMGKLFSKTVKLFNKEEGPSDLELNMAIKQLSSIVDPRDDNSKETIRSFFDH